ncbi:MAG: HEAT repeat domain-containing protein, partial [Planctomycetota bacterium]|jgi:HEAT repeat protein
LRRDDGLLAASAARALGRIGDDGPQTIASLHSALRHQTSEVAAAAAFSLGRLGPKAKTAIPRLKELMRRDESSAFAAAAGLVKLGQKDAGMGLLTKKLGSRNERDVEAAAKALAYLGPAAADAVDDLAGALSTRDSVVRRKIIFALGAIGPAAKPAVPALRALKGDRESVAKALASILPPAATQDSVAGLIKLLKGTDTGMRRYAASSLGERKAEQAAQALPALYEGLADNDARVRLECLYALMRVDPDAEKKIAGYAAQAGPLIGAAAARCDDDGFVRWSRFAGRLGTVASPAIGDLHEAVLARKSPRPAAALAEALADMGPDAVGPFMRARRANTNRNLRTGALCAAWVARGKEGIPFLRAVLKHSHHGVEYAVRMMIPMGPDAAAAIPELVQLLEVKSGLAAGWTAKVLGNIGSDDDRVMNALSEAMNSSDYYLRAHAALALGKIGSPEKTKPLLPKLRKCLYSDESMEVCYAAGALLSLKEGEHCIELLRQQLKGRHPVYVAEACEVAGPAAADLVADLISALKAIGPEGWHYSNLEQGLLRALSRAGAPADALIPALVDRLLRARSRKSRLMIIDMLKPSVPTSEAARKALAKASRGRDAVAAKAAKDPLAAGTR